MRTTEENQRLQEKEANDAGYAESSFYENISNLSYIKDFHKAWGKNIVIDTVINDKIYNEEYWYYIFWIKIKILFNFWQHYGKIQIITFLIMKSHFDKILLSLILTT